MMILSIEQERAKYALDCIKEVKEKDEKSQNEYVSHLKNVPILILTNGLGNTFAFIQSKSKQDAYKMLYKHLNEWLKKRQFYETDILKWIPGAPTLVVYRAAEEVLALVNWMKQFAEGALG